MSLKFKYTPLSFLKNNDQIKEQIKNTVILKYFFDLNNKKIDLQKLIEGTQYGYNASALESGANKFLRISDITDGKVDWSKVPFCDCKDESTYLLKNEDLLIARTGGTTGKSFLINNPPSKAIYAGYLIRIRANQNSLPEYLDLFLNSYAYWSQILSLNKGEFRPSVNATKLKKLQLPNCTIEQQAVAIKLAKGEPVIGYESLTERIELALNQFQKSKSLESLFHNQKSLLTQLRQAILQEAIQGKLTSEWRTQNSELITGKNSAASLLENIKTEKAQLVKEKKIKKEKPLPPIKKEEIPFELPEGWTWCRLGELTTYGSSEKIESENIKPDTWVLDLEDIEKDSSKIIQIKTFEERPSLSTKSVFKKGWVLYSKLRPYLNKVVVVEKDGVCTTEILPLPVYGGIVSEFLMYGMKRKDFLQYVNSKVSGMKMPRLKTDDGKNAIIPLAPLKEQKGIVQKIESLMEKCTALEQKITQSEQHAQMLMQAVLKEAFEEEEETNKQKEAMV